MTKASDVVAFLVVCAFIVLLFWVFSAPKSNTIGNTGLISRPTGGSAGSESSPLNFYSDFSGTIPVTEIDWAEMTPASSKDSTIYVRNTAQRQLALTFSTDKWTPANASDYMTLSWDAPESLSVQAGEIKSMTLTLSIASNITDITAFSFDIIIWYD